MLQIIATSNHVASVRHKPAGFITGTFFKNSLFHKLIQTSIEIKVLHLQDINTIFTIFLFFLL
ncbi:hypothetical protein QFZ51_002310 [Chitinophaga sp. W3I9]